MAAHIKYFHLGQWPVYIGFTTSPKQFAKECERLSVKDVQFTARTGAGATMHSFENTKNGSLVCIITIGKFDENIHSREQYAAMIAHEALHVVQEMRNVLNRSRPFDDECEAYLTQYITQECLQVAWRSGKTRQDKPPS